MVGKVFRVAEAARELRCSEAFMREAEKKGKLHAWRSATD